MSNRTIQQLPVVVSTNPNDVIPIVQNDVTSQIRIGDLPQQAVTYKKVLYGPSFNNQVPPNNDIPMRLTFGPNQTTPEVTLNGFGEIQFLQEGNYNIVVTLTSARKGAAGGSSGLLFFMNLGGSQIGATQLIKLSGATETRQMTMTEFITVGQDEFLEIYCMRDSQLSTGTGLTEGGVYGYPVQYNPTDPVRSATLTITKVS